MVSQNARSWRAGGVSEIASTKSTPSNRHMQKEPHPRGSRAQDEARWPVVFDCRAHRHASASARSIAARSTRSGGIVYQTIARQRLQRSSTVVSGAGMTLPSTCPQSGHFTVSVATAAAWSDSTTQTPHSSNRTPGPHPGGAAPGPAKDMHTIRADQVSAPTSRSIAGPHDLEPPPPPSPVAACAHNPAAGPDPAAPTRRRRSASRRARREGDG